ncbi:methyltransferase [Salinarimonas ramus]|uniref:O-methyltransferase n=1 Tax=Salinarimonas ramus TaxID=690164 RepID=A0A917QEI8_9HYPH|nr:methyltransferase [Salinarimonas ramus]GGK46625.1 O-methyltransferase [Salinarimonas ramus]
MRPPDLVLALRDRLVSSERFQAFAERFAPTRGIARRRASALFDIVAGFVYTQTLLACLRLDLFETLRGNPLTPAEIAARTGLPEEGARRLLDAACAIGLLQPRSRGRIGLGPHGAAVLGNPAVAPMALHHPLLYEDLADPVACLARGPGGGALARYWAYARAADPAALADEAVGAYTDLMAASQPMVARQILDAYDVSRHATLMDVGGGAGAFLRAAAARAPKTRLVLFDLPPVARAASARFAADGLGDRIEAIGGDMFADPLPEGADAISLVRILHDHDDAQALAILEAVRAALPPGGVAIIGEPMSGTPGAQAVTQAYFGLYLYAMGSGRPRTPPENAAMAREAGFASTRFVKTRVPLVASVLVATV